LAGGSIRFTACSSSVFRERAQQGGNGGKWQVTFNGVEVGKYDFVSRVATDAPLAFLGRLERLKGAHHAIAIARAAGKRLIVAGNRVQNGPAADYFDWEIAPKVDGTDIIYLGPVDDTQKNALLGSAAALLIQSNGKSPLAL
jgi:glycosyltransferase involved in cell wall biosynthesis